MAQTLVKQEPVTAKSLLLGEIGTGASGASPADFGTSWDFHHTWEGHLINTKPDKPTESSRDAACMAATSPDKPSDTTVENKSDENERDKETRPELSSELQHSKILPMSD